MSAEKVALVTVGTTKFDELIRTVCTADVCQILRSQNFTRLVLQIGCGEFEPDPRDPVFTGLAVEVFRLKESLRADIGRASLIIGHAGAGTVLGALADRKPMIAVVNDSLMGNHQEELARKMAEAGHMMSCYCDELVSCLERVDGFEFVPYPPGRPEVFAHFLDTIVGFS